MFEYRVTKLGIVWNGVSHYNVLIKNNKFHCSNMHIIRVRPKPALEHRILFSIIDFIVITKLL